jgi:hypothetical protein
MSQQRNRKQSRNRAAAPDDGLLPALSPSPGQTAEPVADEHGYLAIGLAASAMAIVALLTIMIILAAT